MTEFAGQGCRARLFQQRGVEMLLGFALGWLLLWALSRGYVKL